MNKGATPLDLVPSITKDSASFKTVLPAKPPPDRRETYVPPRMEELADIEDTGFQSSIIMQ